jgi:Arc/MetJ-type ribon-helix-helix transcriptional regulator
MMIHVSKDVENAINAAVQSGQFASADEMIAKLVREYDQQHRQLHAATPPAAPARKPIWERILERTATIPDEEWDKLPVDGAEQHDHYIYGTPKRPTQ